MQTHTRPQLLLVKRLASATAFLAILVSACGQTGGATSSPTNAASQRAASNGIGQGTFHDVDGTAAGEAQLVVKPDGTYDLVLESFTVDSIAHTNLVLVPNADVTATAGKSTNPSCSTLVRSRAPSMQDFVIPADMASSVMDGYHTAVIWDTEMATCHHGRTTEVADASLTRSSPRQPPSRPPGGCRRPA